MKIDQDIALLIDGNALMHRAYHAVKFAPTYNNQPFGMVYGFTSSLLNTINFFTPKYCVVAFDTKEKTFRHEMDKNYKAQRSKAPDDFYPQLIHIDEMLETLSIPVIRKPGFEADDIIGTLALKAEKSDFHSIILSHDMDYTQLMSDRVTLCRSIGKIDDSVLVTPKMVLEKYGLPPEKIVDFKAIVGDSSDNYKGVEGIGPKGALDLMLEFGDLETILKNISSLPEKFRKKIEGNEAYVRHCQILARIETSVPIDFDYHASELIPLFGSLAQLCEKWGFLTLKSRVQKISSLYEASSEFEQINSSTNSNNRDQMILF